MLARQLLAFVRSNGLCLQARGALLFDLARQASDRFIVPSRHFWPDSGVRTEAAAGVFQAQSLPVKAPPFRADVVKSYE
jgi:hypothetical protein